MASVHLQRFWQDVIILGFWHTELVFHWDLDKSTHNPSLTTWYVHHYYNETQADKAVKNI
jgi:hypothetical protein